MWFRRKARFMLKCGSVKNVEVFLSPPLSVVCLTTGNKLAYYATKDVSTENHAQFMDSDASLYSSYNCFFAHSSRIGGEKILKVRVLKYLFSFVKSLRTYFRGMNFLGKANIDLNELPLDRSDQKV